MKLPVIIFLVTTLGILRESDAGFIDGVKHFFNKVFPSTKPSSKGCDEDITIDYRRAIYDFATKVYKQAATDHSDHFVISPKSIWMSVAAIAEGAEGEAQQKLFKALSLPEERCLREKYYHLALITEPAGFDVTLDRKAAIYLDDSLEINSGWEEYVRSQGLLDIKTAPIKKEPQDVVEQLRQYISARIPEPNLSGNSVLLDSLYYESMWTYSDASVHNSTFYSDSGEEIGTVELLKIKKHVKLVHLPLLHAKILSMPVGKDDRYVMLYALAVGSHRIRSVVELFKNTVIFEILEGLRESLIPLEVAIPRVTVSSEVDVRRLLEEIGIENLWSDPAASSKISEPAALPSAYYERVTVKLDSTRIEPPKNEPTGLLADLANLATGLEAAIGRDFIANKPFMYGLFDTKTFSCIFNGLYSGPN